jgi:hypothetical protein
LFCADLLDRASRQIIDGRDASQLATASGLAAWRG